MIKTELRQFNAVSIRELEDICNRIRNSVITMKSITPQTTQEEVMYAAGVNFAFDRLLSIINSTSKQER
jgi:hypothetical protein|nr:MAG TPA: hypothetical protein [Caudoviricetes sp.]